MLEKPDLPEPLLLARLREAYDIPAARVTFLPLGVDVHTAVYRAGSADGKAWFVKARTGPFDPAIVSVPHFLHSRGVPAVMAPCLTAQGQLWAPFDPYTLIVYPYVDGQDGYQQTLTDAQWIAFGAVMASIHAAQLPAELADRLPRETFSTFYRQQVAWFQDRVEHETFAEPVAARLAAFMRAHRAEIQALVQRTGQLALELQACVLPQVLCHSDLHPGNLLIHSQPGNGPGFHIVDWDQPVLAPRERDLMGIGGGLGARWSSPREVELFYQGYGQPLDNIDRAALTYYRCERILMDITEFCKQLLLSDAGGADRPQALEYFTSSFLPGHEIEAARKGDPFPCSVKNEW